MKFSLKSLAVAVTLAAAAAGANAAIDDGYAGNGELFLNVWDFNGSYTFDTNLTIDAFEAALATPGAFSQSWAADANFVSFMSTATLEDVRWNVVAGDIDGESRLLVTFSELGSGNIRNNVGTNAAFALGQFALAVNEVNRDLGIDADSLLVTNIESPAYAGKDMFGDKINNGLNFSNAGTVANNSYADGLSFLRADMKDAKTTRSIYNVYADEGNAVKLWLDGSGLHMASAVTAVPEPSEYALLLAGLGLIGFMARRNKRA